MQFGKWVIPVALIASLSACAHDPLDAFSKPHAPMSKAVAIGAMAGTTTGVAVGAITGMSIPLTAVVGGAAGAATGLVLSNFPLTYPYQLSHDKINIYDIGNKVHIMLPTDKIFEFNSQRILPSSYEILNQVVSVMNLYGDKPITIISHTDNIGAAHIAQNTTLNQARALEHYLWTHGEDHYKITPVGAGSEYPVAENNRPEGHRLNRRIDIVIDKDA